MAIASPTLDVFVVEILHTLNPADEESPIRDLFVDFWRGIVEIFVFIAGRFRSISHEVDEEVILSRNNASFVAKLDTRDSEGQRKKPGRLTDLTLFDF